MADYQREQVFRWEHAVLEKFPPCKIKFANIPTIVDFIWEQEGLKNPPVVKKLPRKSINEGDGMRSRVRFPGSRRTPLIVVIHELAHAMNCYKNDSFRGEAHGPEWLGIYMHLLDEYAHIPLVYLMATTEEYGLVYDLSAETIG